MNHFIFVYGLVGETVTHDIYINGAYYNHDGGGGNGALKTITTDAIFGKHSLSFLNGWMDEVMILDTIKSAGWYTSFYNMVNHRSVAFYSVGAEESASATGLGTNIEITDRSDLRMQKEARWNGLV